VVHEFFGAAAPDAVRLEYVETGPSQFHPESSSVSISGESLKRQSELGVVAHETAHLALARLTRGASTNERLRFVDEGLASILQSRAEKDAKAYRARALVVAAQRAREDDAILVHAERWSEYFGDPKTSADFEAYEVGAAFDLFLLDAFGPERTRRLLADLAETRDLEASCARVLLRDLSDIERAWRESLRQIPIVVPRVVTQSPANEDEGARVDLTELAATFDVPMDPRICLNAPCHEGICYDHATWRSPTELVVRLTQPLTPGRWYEVSLGTGRCRLKSRAGVAMPVAIWRFKTRSAR
jgi:hypothetical protein